jgi:type IV secretion system protein VirB4
MGRENDRLTNETQTMTDSIDLARHVPFSQIVSDSVISSRNGDFISTWRIYGIDVTSRDELSQTLEMNKLNTLIRTMGTGEFSFVTHRIPRKVQSVLTIPKINTFVDNLLTKYYGITNEYLHTTEHYLTVIYRPQKISGGMGFSFRLKNYNEQREKAIGILGEVNRTIKTNFKEYRVTQLGKYEAEYHNYSSDSENVNFDGENKQYRNSQAEFYCFLINGDWQTVPHKMKSSLYKILPTSRIVYGTFYKESLLADGRKRFSYFIDIKDYEAYTHAGIIDTLINLPFEFIETQIFVPMTKVDALKTLTQIRGQLLSAEDDGLTQVIELDQAKEGVVNGNFVYGFYSYQIEVFGDTMEEAKEARQQVIRELGEAGFLPANVDSIVNHAHYASWPCNYKHRTRTAHVSSRNFAGMNSFHNYSTGKKNYNPWGEAILMLTTANGQPYYLNLHESPDGIDNTDKKTLGNTAIIGQAGTGKTVLTNMIILSSFKYGCKSVYFDKDRGCEIGIRAYGGSYINIYRNEKSGLAPFKLEPTKQNVDHWKTLIKHCAKEGGYTLTPSHEADIEKGVDAVAGHPKHQRGFELLMQYLDPTDPNGVAARLKKWCRGEALGWALDNEDDLLKFKPNSCTGIDYTELLDDKEVCPTIMLYLMFRTENEIDGKPFIYVMEEYWKALENESFEDFAKNKQKTIRKLNGLGIFVTQQPSDALGTNISKTLIEQTATMIFLPNPQASKDDYCGGYKLTELEYEIVRNLAPNSRKFLIKKGMHSTVVQLSLNGMDDELDVISGTKDNLEPMEQAIREKGDNPDMWVPHYLELVKKMRVKTGEFA